MEIFCESGTLYVICKSTNIISLDLLSKKILQIVYFYQLEKVNIKTKLNQITTENLKKSIKNHSINYLNYHLDLQFDSI
ncbi:MAG: hypothetical protein ACK5HL_04930 [Bacilli bacterium]